jgi:phage/plasmid primase-like uncharacterized protein
MLDFNDAAPAGQRRTNRADRKDDAPQPPPDLRELQRVHEGDLSHGGQRLLMPGPGHTRRDRSLSVRRAPDGRLLVHSFVGDPLATILDYLGVEAGQGRAPSPQEAQQEREARQREAAAERARKAAFCNLVSAGTEPAAGSPVEAYLRSRAITGPIPEALRFHPAAPLGYEGGGVYTAMVATVTSADGPPAGLHVTFIKPDGSAKAFGDRSRRMFGNMGGAAVRLSATTPGELAVAEGIETALSWRELSGQAVWACMSAALLGTFTPPTEVRALTVAADGDEAGRREAAKLVDRVKRRCATATAAAPDGRDWNDVLREAAQ